MITFLIPSHNYAKFLSKCILSINNNNPKFIKEIIFFDRYVHDIIVDPLRYRINLNRKSILFLLNLFPMPDFWCFMTGDANQIWSRKKEVKFEILKTQLSKYKKLKVKFKNSLSISKKKQFDVVFNIIQKKYRSINK